MKIKVSDEKKVKELLAEVQKKSQVRNLSFEGIKMLAERAEEKLNILPKKERYGAKYHSISFGTFPKSYKFIPIGTLITLMRGSKDWFIISCYRGDCRGKDWFDINEKQKQIIAEKAINQICGK